MRGVVRIPAGELITLGAFAKALADATATVKFTDLTGLDCIIGKWVVPNAAPSALQPEDAKRATYSDLVGKDLAKELTAELDLFQQGPALVAVEMPQEQGSLDFPREEDQGFPYALNDGDRAFLERIIADLPPLKYPLSGSESWNFVQAFKAHKDFPGWLPRLITSMEVERRQIEYANLLDRHRAAIKQDAEAGHLRLLSDDGVPLQVFTINASIIRASALDYLSRYGHSVPERDAPGAGAGVFTAEGKRVKKRENNEAWTYEELEAIDLATKSIDPETGKLYTKQKIADLLDMSRTNVYELLELFEKMKIKNMATSFSMKSQVSAAAGNSQKGKTKG